MSLELRATNVFRRNQNSGKPIILNRGGAGSSKSHSIAQLLALRFLQCSNRRILVTRKTLPSLRLTAYKLIQDLLKEWGFYNSIAHNKGERTMEFASNYMAFLSIDDPEKIKSTDWNDAWMEEANEFTYDDFMILRTRLRHPKTNDLPNQMFLSLNPDEDSWIHEKLESLSTDELEVIHSTYRDNPFLDTDYIDYLKGLKNEDEAYFKIYAEGLYARRIGRVHNNWKVVPKVPKNPKEVVYGLDFGYTNPSALLEVNIFDNEEYDIIIRELLYEPQLTNADLMVKVSDAIPFNLPDIYADTAEPQRVEEFNRYERKPPPNVVEPLWRFRCHASDKSIIDGIDQVNRLRIGVTEDSINCIREFKRYKWKVGRDGKPVHKEEPVKMWDHLMNALRYVVHTRKLAPGPAISITAKKKGETYIEKKSVRELISKRNPRNPYAAPRPQRRRPR